MSAGRNRYAMLMCSLPVLPTNLFSERHTPISRLQLDRRLSLLEAEDAHRLAAVEDVLHWNRLPLDLSDRQALALYRSTAASLPPGPLQEVVRWRLEERTLIAALRRRQLGRPAPMKNEEWGCGRWLLRIQQAWHEPAFGLERQFPWLGEAARRLAANDVPGLEHLLLGHAWQVLGRMNAGHHFDFPAVLFYVLKWDILHRWSNYNGEAALRRFMKLSDAGLANAYPAWASPASNGHVQAAA